MNKLFKSIKVLFFYIIHPKVLGQRWCLYVNLRKLKKCDFNYEKPIRLRGKLMIRLYEGVKIKFGSNVLIFSGDNLNPLAPNIRGSIFMTHNSILEIGDNTGLSCPHIRVKEVVRIGKNVNVGADCIIMDTDCHSMDFLDRRNRRRQSNGFSFDYCNAKSAPIVIEDDVLIGARSIILKGVTIGARSVIGAGSVVTKSIPADCIAAGNPCKVIKYLNGQ